MFKSCFILHVNEVMVKIYIFSSLIPWPQACKLINYKDQIWNSRYIFQNLSAFSGWWNTCFKDCYDCKIWHSLDPCVTHFHFNTLNCNPAYYPKICLKRMFDMFVWYAYTYIHMYIISCIQHAFYRYNLFMFYIMYF